MKKLTLENKLRIAKKATRIVVGYGTGIIASGAVISNTLPPKNIVQKVAVVIAGAVIVMAAKDKIGDYSDAKFDELVQAARELFEKEEAKENVVEAEIVE